MAAAWSVMADVGHAGQVTLCHRPAVLPLNGTPTGANIGAGTMAGHHANVTRWRIMSITLTRFSLIYSALAMFSPQNGRGRSVVGETTRARTSQRRVSEPDVRGTPIRLAATTHRPFTPSRPGGRGRSNDTLTCAHTPVLGVCLPHDRGRSCQCLEGIPPGGRVQVPSPRTVQGSQGVPGQVH